MKGRGKTLLGADAHSKSTLHAAHFQKYEIGVDTNRRRISSIRIHRTICFLSVHMHCRIRACAHASQYRPKKIISPDSDINME